MITIPSDTPLSDLVATYFLAKMTGKAVEYQEYIVRGGKVCRFGFKK